MKTKKVSFQRYLESRIADKDLNHNGFHPITPYHLLESIETARKALSFSNYDCENYKRVIEILIRYYREHGIDISGSMEFDYVDWDKLEVVDKSGKP